MTGRLYIHSKLQYKNVSASKYVNYTKLMQISTLATNTFRDLFFGEIIVRYATVTSDKHYKLKAFPKLIQNVTWIHHI